MGVPKAGQRLRCDQCGTEVVVIKSPDQVPKCCGQPLSDPSQKEQSVGK
jgi:rubrerythrin